MAELEEEIKSHHILAFVRVRGEGNVRGEHTNRCLWPICGKSMLQWVMKAAKDSKYIDKIAVITDSKEIKEVLEKIGGIVIIDLPLWQVMSIPRDFTKGTFRRNKPRSLQSKEAPIYTTTVDYTFYYLNETEHYKPDLWIHIGANDPLITSKILDRLIEGFFKDEEASSINGVTPIMPSIYTINPITKRLFPVFALPSLDKQKFPPLYRKVGSLLLGLAAKRSHSYFPKAEGQEGYVEILPEDNVDVHNEEDLFLAKCYMRRRLAREKGGDWIPDEDAVKTKKEIQNV